MKTNSSYQKNSDYYKASYDNICVDDEMKNKLKMLEMTSKKKMHSHIIKMTVAAAAAFCLMFTGLVNANTAFASSVEKIPVIGQLAKLVNFRSYAEETPDYDIKVSIPSIKDNGSKNSTAAKMLNAEILKLCEQYAHDAKERALDYKQVFLETGGTEEEWKEHDISISVDYEIKNETNDYLSFVIYGYESWLTSDAIASYYNLNVHTMEYVTLENLFGEDYIDFINREIKRQIKERKKNKTEQFFTQEEGGFQSISEDQNYYLNSDGNAVIVFDKYTIAPGFMGNVEFEIQTP